MTQLVRLGAVGIKYLFKALKFVLGKVFNTRNIVAPVKFLLRLILGEQFSRRKESQSLEYLE
jgi:hypothetical protein